MQKPKKIIATTILAAALAGVTQPALAAAPPSLAGLGGASLISSLTNVGAIPVVGTFLSDLSTVSGGNLANLGGLPVLGTVVNSVNLGSLADFNTLPVFGGVITSVNLISLEASFGNLSSFGGFNSLSSLSNLNALPLLSSVNLSGLLNSLANVGGLANFGPLLVGSINFNNLTDGSLTGSFAALPGLGSLKLPSP